jgi:hypothetical protein
MKKEVEMFRRICLAVLCIVVLSTTTAMADIGPVNISLTVVPYPGTRDIDLQVTATTTGTAVITSGEPMLMVGSIYYPTPWSVRTTSVGYTATAFRQGLTNVFSYTFQLTAPFSADWGTYAFAYGFGAAGTYHYDYTYGGAFPLNDQGIPTMTPLGIAILGALMAGLGIVILRRT